MLKSGSSLTVVGPGSHQSAVFEWIDTLLHRHRAEVAVAARLYPHAAGSTRAFRRRFQSGAPESDDALPQAALPTDGETELLLPGLARASEAPSQA
jgi:hypothetical protein